jgi:hypothetical protein
MKKLLAILLAFSLSINYAISQTAYCNSKIEQYNNYVNKVIKLYKEMLSLPNADSDPRGKQITNEVKELSAKVLQFQNELVENSCLENQKIYDRFVVIAIKLENSLSSSSSNNQTSSQNSKNINIKKSNKHECKWCSKIFNGDGYRYYIKNKETVWEKIEVTKGGKFCSGGCAIQYYNNTGERVYY